MVEVHHQGGCSLISLSEESSNFEILKKVSSQTTASSAKLKDSKNIKNRDNQQLEKSKNYADAVVLPFPDILDGSPRLGYHSLLFVLALVSLGPLIIMHVIKPQGLVSGSAAMYLMHIICMSSIPVLTILYITNDLKYYMIFFETQIIRKWRSQIQRCAVFFLLGYISSVITHDYILVPTIPIESFGSPKQVHTRFVGPGGRSTLEHPLTIFTGFWFIFINPFFEEFFWRLFLVKEVGYRYFQSVESPSEPVTPVSAPKLLNADEMSCNAREKSTQLPEDNQTFDVAETSEEHSSQFDKTVEGNQEDKYEFQSSGSRFKNIYNFFSQMDDIFRNQLCIPAETDCQFNDLNVKTESNGSIRESKIDNNEPRTPSVFADTPVSFMGHLCVSILYASYHAVVMIVNGTSPWATLCGMSFLVTYGLLFSLTRCKDKCGWLCTYALHVGVDAAVIRDMLVDVL